MFDLLIFIFHSLYDCTHNGDEPPKECYTELPPKRTPKICVFFDTEGLFIFIFAVSNSIRRLVWRQQGGEQALGGHGEPVGKERILLAGQSEVPRPTVSAVTHETCTADSTFPKQTITEASNVNVQPLFGSSEIRGVGHYYYYYYKIQNRARSQTTQVAKKRLIPVQISRTLHNKILTGTKTAKNPWKWHECQVKMRNFAKQWFINCWYYFGSLHHVSGEFFDVWEGRNGSIAKVILVHVFADVIHRREQESVTLKMRAVRSSEKSKHWSTTQRRHQEDQLIKSRRENLKACIVVHKLSGGQYGFIFQVCHPRCAAHSYKHRYSNVKYNFGLFCC